MYKNCSTEESAKRQRQLENCLLELMLSRSYDHITISDICERVNISRKSFYRYFSSKDGCLFAMIDHAIIDGAAYYMVGPYGAPPKDATLLFFRYWIGKTDLLRALYNNRMSTWIIERLIRYILKEEPEFCQQLGGEAKAKDKTMFIISGLFALLLSRLHDKEPQTPEQLAQIVMEIMREP